MRDTLKREEQVATDVLANGRHDEDGSFPVKVYGAGVEPFQLQVQGFWTVQECVCAALLSDEVMPRSSLSLSLSGATLDPGAELSSIKGFKPGVTLRLTEELYSPRSARAHVERLQELLRAAGPNSLREREREGCSPSLLHTLTHTPESIPAVHSKGLKRSVSKTENPPPEMPTPDLLLPGATQRPPFTMLLPTGPNNQVPACLLELSLSSWNPPPGHRKLQGDFLYLALCTLEGRRCDVTSCPRGFFLNKSTVEVFDPQPAPSSPLCHCLADLLSLLSSKFKHNLTTLKHRPALPAVEEMATPYRTVSWLGAPTHRNTFRLDLDTTHTQAPDWNEELQAARDLPQGSLEERTQRDRALLQVNSAFVLAAAQGAEAVIDGSVEPIAGGSEEPSFLWGGAFLSAGGAGGGGVCVWGERGRRAVQRMELRGVQAYAELQGGLSALRTLPTAVVDYRGVRVSAQGLAPGLLEGGGSPQGLLYGYSAGLQESPHRRKLLELLAQAAKALALQRHSVLGPLGHPVPLFTSTDAQGLLGADGRYYLLDVFRSMPADANFHPAGEREEGESEGGEEEKQEGESRELTFEASAAGLPCPYPHGLCRLRPELVKAFIQYKEGEFTWRVREWMEQNGGVEDCVQPGDARGSEAVRGACKDVGSVSDIIFEMRFNPNVFSPGVQFPRADSRDVQLQERILREAAAFIISHQIPAFIEECVQCVCLPVDGAMLCQALHHRGINLRYLGQLTAAISQSQDRDRLRHITRLVYGEIVVRSARRIFNSFLQGVEVSNLSAFVSHFLCCLLVPHFSPASTGEEPKKRSRRRGRGGGVAGGVMGGDSAGWSALSGSELWNLISQEGRESYNLTHGLGTSVDHLVEQYGLHKVSLLRELCLKTGVQLSLRDYVLDNHGKAPISPGDIVNILPVVKHIAMTTSDASAAFHSAQSSLQKGLKQQAYEQCKEAAYLFGRVCDDLSSDACSCLSLLAQLAYLQGNHAEARSVQMRVVVISERVLGFDHPNTIHQYAVLGVYVYAGGEAALAQRCLFRARLLMLHVHGEDHPYTATLDSSLGLLLEGAESVQYLQSALKLNTFYRGAIDLQTALSHHLLAQKMCVLGDYRGAMTHEREALNIFQTQCGEVSPQARCSSDFLSAITQQAVRVERSLRQGGAERKNTPETLTPSTETTLEQLSLVTGILNTSHSNRLQEFKEKLKIQRAVEKMTTNQSEPSVATNGEEAQEQTTNEGEVIGEATPTDGPAQYMTNENTESHQEERNLPQQKSDQSNVTHTNGDKEGGAPAANDQSELTNGDVCLIATSNQSDLDIPKANEEESGEGDGAPTAESQSGSEEVVIALATGDQSEATVMNGEESEEASGETDKGASSQ